MRTLVLANLLLTGTRPWITSAFPFEPVGGFESDGVRDPTRAHDLAGVSDPLVTDGEFRYLRSLKPESLYLERHVMGFDGRAKLTNVS